MYYSVTARVFKEKKLYIKIMRKKYHFYRRTRLFPAAAGRLRGTTNNGHVIKILSRILCAQGQTRRK